MAPIARDLNTVFDYQLRVDRAPDGATDPTKTIFELQVIAHRVRAEIQDSAIFAEVRRGSGEQVVHTRPAMTEARLLEAGVRGWRNFVDGEGKEIACRTPEQRSLLPDLLGDPDYVTELAEAISAGSQVDAAEGN